MGGHDYDEIGPGNQGKTHQSLGQLQPLLGWEEEQIRSISDAGQGNQYVQKYRHMNCYELLRQYPAYRDHNTQSGNKHQRESEHLATPDRIELPIEVGKGHPQPGQ